MIKTFHAAMKEFGNIEIAARISNTTPYQLVYNYCRRTLDQHSARRVAELVLQEKGVKSIA